MDYNTTYLIIGGILVLLAIRLFFRKRLMLFYTEKCGHCQSFKPEWEKIKLSCSIPTSEIDCGLYPEKCSGYKIAGYPTLMITGDGLLGISNKEYQGPRTEEAINEFCK